MEALRPAILEMIVTQHFDNLVNLVIRAKKAKAILDDKLNLREQSRNRGSNDKKANMRNLGQLQSQISQSSSFSKRLQLDCMDIFAATSRATKRSLVLSLNRNQPYLKVGHRETKLHLYHSKAIR
ncbi:hypothetical protein PanWU01x14_030860 [Parasponia andersonii]|uniref:Uncharacterized protein n=1 Tax=Parasponia andersonii TaxID=3476 RepID=A0A2P5DUX2_PARAD|nr:hypothetical protein PanWU01x14_030860 [Parasponia andersonii]